MNTRSPSSLNHHDNGPAAPKVELRIERVGRTLRYQLASRPLAGGGRLLGDAAGADGDHHH